MEALVRTGTVTLEGGRRAQVDLGPETVSALRSGDAVQALVYADGWKSTVVRLKPIASREVGVEGDELDSVLAQRQIAADGGFVRLDDVGMRDLLDAGETWSPIWREDVPGELTRVRLTGGDPPARPVAGAFVVDNLTEFLSAPIIPTTDGRSVALNLDAEAVRELRFGEATTVQAGGREVTLFLNGLTPVEDDVPHLGPAYTLDPKYTVYDLRRVHRDLYWAKGGGWGGTTGSGTGTGTAPVAQAPLLSRSGLPVAILLPWRQTFALEGFTRGNLLSSLALAPGEETRITVASWERRAKALVQSAETETEQTFDYTSTTRDTEDVFKEMVQSNEFSAQAHASLDASYSSGVATVQLGADGSLSQTNSLSATARTSTQHVQESVSRASTRVRARRITTISESLERTTSTETVRTIRNPSMCSTLTLNFHEVLAHYTVKMSFDKPAVRIVVLVPNPHHVTKFDELAVRMHEATLRQGLLDAALVDGFEACRLLKAYSAAEGELVRLSGMAKQERELNREREKPAPDDDAKPPNPKLAPLVALLKDLRERYVPFPGAGPMAALTSLADWKQPAEDPTLAENRWLWRRLVVTKFGSGLLDALAAIPASPGPDDARRVAAAVPSAGGFPTLDGLAQCTDKDKEDAGLYSTVATNWSAAWWWWYPRLKDNRMYDVVDNGIAGLVAQVKTAFQAWEAKEAEGEGMQKADAVLEQSKNEQAQATLADRLEMKFGAEVIGSAMERREALLGHLNEHVDYYRYVLFQGMPPSEQLQRLMDIAPQLRIGMFEPHVVASDGPNLAVPLTPLAETTLAKLVTNLSGLLEKAAQEAQDAGDAMAADKVILTTPGVSVESWRGSCSGCDDHTEALRAAEVRRAEAEADSWEAEARRRTDRLDANPPQLDDPVRAVPTVRLAMSTAPEPDLRCPENPVP